MKQLVSPGSSFGPTWGDNFSDSSDNKLFALYQGTTEEAAEKLRVVPVLGLLWFIFSFCRGYWVRFY
jgi:hypothetical protein